jgi:hypothetical protein
MYIKCITFWLICEEPTKDIAAANKAPTLCTGTKISPLVLGLMPSGACRKPKFK